MIETAEAIERDSQMKFEEWFWFCFSFDGLKKTDSKQCRHWKTNIISHIIKWMHLKCWFYGYDKKGIHFNKCIKKICERFCCRNVEEDTTENAFMVVARGKWPTVLQGYMDYRWVCFSWQVHKNREIQ